MERHHGDLILCSKCKRYLPRESFPEYNLKKHYHCCRECFKKELRDYNIKTRKYKGTRRTHEEIELLKDPHEEIAKTIEGLIKELENPRDRGEHVCNYCDKQATKTDLSNPNNPIRCCDKHFLIYCLKLGKPLKTKSISKNGTQFINYRKLEERELRILQRLEQLGVKIEMS